MPTNTPNLSARLGRNLRAIRLGRDLSQKSLARHMGVNPSYIGSIERGERNLTLASMVDLAGDLGVPWEDLLADPDAGDGAASHTV